MQLTVGDTIVESEIETLQLGSEIRFGSVALRNQTISDMVEDAVGIKDLSLKVYDLTIAADLSSFTVGAIGAEIGNSISLFWKSRDAGRVGGCSCGAQSQRSGGHQTGGRPEV